MSDDRYSPDEFTDWPEGIVGAEEQDERVFWLAAATMPDLVNRLALVLGEHMACGDDCTSPTTPCSQAFSTSRPQRDGSLWTDLHFEYSAFVVLRPRPPPPLKSLGRRRGDDCN